MADEYLNTPIIEHSNHVYSTIAVFWTCPSVYHLCIGRHVEDFVYDFVLPSKVHLRHGAQSSNILRLGQARPFAAQFLDYCIDGFEPGRYL